VSAISVPHPISWADEERDLTAWLGNELQDEAFGKLYSYESKVRNCNNPEILKDWLYLQTSNHFYYMCTKWFSAGEVHKYFNPYGSPYEAFINYMNVLSDFMIRVDESCGTITASAKAPVEKKVKKTASSKVSPVKVTEKKKAKKSPSAKVVRKKK
jgi:alpha-amylase